MHPNALFILSVDNMRVSFEDICSSEVLLQQLKDQRNHIVVICTRCLIDPHNFVDSISNRSHRGCHFHEVRPLSPTQTVRRMAHAVFKEVEFIPTDEDRLLFSQLTDCTCGSPPVTDVAIALIIKAKQSLQPLQEWNPFHNNGDIDAIDTLIDACQLSMPENCLLYYLSLLGSNPIPSLVVDQISDKICAQCGLDSTGHTLREKLMQCNLLRLHPSPVVYHSALNVNDRESYSVPLHISAHVLQDVDCSHMKNAVRDVLIRAFSNSRDPLIRGLISVVDDE